MKRYLARILAAALIAATSLTVCVPAMASDTPSSWAASKVNEAISYGLIPEEVQGNYQAPITRLDFAILMEELCNDHHGKGSYQIYPGYDQDKFDEGFTDTDEWAVKRMYAAWVMNGTGDGKFSPNATLTREMAATIINNFANFVSSPLPAGSVTFADSGSISSWAKDAVGKVTAAGIMNGVGNNLFDPQGTITREQAILTAFQAYQYVKGVGNSSSGSSSQSSQNTAPVYSGDFATVLQQLYTGMSNDVSRLEIANATEKNWPSSDTFTQVDGDALRRQYPGHEIAIGYLEAAHQEMIDACVNAIQIEINGMMGYTASSEARLNAQERAEIDTHIANARSFLERAKSATN